VIHRRGRGSLGVLSAFYGVIEIVFINLAVGSFRRPFLQNHEIVFGFCGHQVNGFANVVLFFEADLDDVRGIVDATGVGIHQIVQKLGMLALRGMIEFVLEFLEAIVGKLDKKFYSGIRSFRIADFVRFDGGKIVLVRTLRI
jgi:hypothetical protein